MQWHVLYTGAQTEKTRMFFVEININNKGLYMVFFYWLAFLTSFAGLKILHQVFVIVAIMIEGTCAMFRRELNIALHLQPSVPQLPTNYILRQKLDRYMIEGYD